MTTSPFSYEKAEREMKMEKETVRQEKEYTEGIRIENKKDHQNGKWDNFWYHYKWPVIGILVFAIIFGVCFAQSCSKEKEDIILLYAGTAPMSPERTEKFNEIMNAVMPRDLDGNGEKKSTLSAYMIYSEEQIRKLEAESDERVDRNFNSSEYRNYLTRVQYGECSVLFLDPWLFEELRDNENQPLQKLSDVLKEPVQGQTEDGFGVRLGDTELYARYEVLQMLPADTVICFGRSYIIGANANEEIYQREKEMFAAIVKGEPKD